MEDVLTTDPPFIIFLNQEMNVVFVLLIEAKKKLSRYQSKEEKEFATQLSSLLYIHKRQLKNYLLL
ncbi:MAG: hypothetical protein WC209_08580 [Ignavibacteriaceae bacterium]|jgi:hypothetical protein